MLGDPSLRDQAVHRQYGGPEHRQLRRLEEAGSAATRRVCRAAARPDAARPVEARYRRTRPRNHPEHRHITPPETRSCREFAGPFAWVPGPPRPSVGAMTQTPAALDNEAVAPVVSGLVRLIAPRKLDRVEADHRLVGDLGFHSLVLAELGYNLEELYGLRSLNPEEAMRLERVSDVIELVSTEVAAGRATLPDADDVAGMFARYGFEGPAA
ncbi:hypothetical protein GCM10009864_61870 [Streptomyces lunalinharesii]|uniref:Acyl carrier protein n=2 Tax=Streptomyces lunalinharesii TaxID=333384 RepID=A0ABN3SMB9_9ACTN